MQKDISLDDLIKKDRQKNRLGKNKVIKKKTNQQGTKVRRNLGGKQSQPKPSRVIKGNQIKGKNNNRNIRRIQKVRQDRVKQVKNKRKNVAKEQNKQKKIQQNKSKNKGETQKTEKGKTLRVLGLQSDITNEELYKIFAAEGALEKCFIQQDNFGRKIPSAIVKYHDPERAKDAAQKFNRHKIRDSLFQIDLLGKK